MPFGIDVDPRPDVTVLRLAGELDMQPASRFKDVVNDLVDHGQVRLLVDLRRLTFCDSIGLSALIHGYQACRLAGGALRVTGATGMVGRLLGLTGVGDLLTDGKGTPTADRENDP
jgi:anti-sigma B factor antagonist